MKRWALILIVVLIAIILSLIFTYTSSAFSGLFITIKEMCFLDLDAIDQLFCDRKCVSKILQKLDSLKVYKKRCKSGHLFYIGSPSYLVSKRKYQTTVKKSNPYLRENFKPLYEELQKHLESRTGKKCYLPGLEGDDFALPGFHFFPGGKLLSKGWRVASVHVDLQYKRLTWPKDKVFNENDTISFTLCLSAPGGSGIYFFDVTKNSLKRKFPLYRSYNQHHVQKVEYEPGHVYLHDGHHYHMISEFYSDEDRITMQGHGIYCQTDHTYWLYW